jgi:hypothetical protein
MDQPSFDVIAFLREPRRPASVATVTGRGRPALAMMWFLLGEGRLWFHTADGDAPSPFLRAAAAGQDVAVMIATFSPPDDARPARGAR